MKISCLSSSRWHVVALSSSLLTLALICFAVTAVAQVGLTVSSNVPAIGPNDFSQTANQAAYPAPGAPDGLNYFADNGVVNSGMAGETFVTGGNAGGYTLTMLSVLTAGGPSDGGVYNLLQPYILDLYEVLNGTNATLIESYTSENVTFNAGEYGDGVWLEWTNLAVPLAANTTYAYGFSRTVTGAGFFGLGWQGSNPFAGGEMCIIPPAGGPITYGASHSYDGSFVINLSLGSTNQSPTFRSQPAPVMLYASRTAKFTAFCAGTTPLSYHWRMNGTNLVDTAAISGSLTNTLVITNVSAANVGNYSLVVSNAVGVSTSSVVALKLVSPPAPGTYAQTILSYNPVAHWRFNDVSNPSTNPPAYDVLGNADGICGFEIRNGYNNIAGPQPPLYAGFETNNFAVHTYNVRYFSQLIVPALNLNTNAVTITAWVNPSTNQVYYNGLFTWRLYADAAAFGFTTNNQLGYSWNTNASTTWSYMSGLIVPTNTWSLVALAISPTGAVFYLMNSNGLQTASNNIPHSAEAFSTPSWIGNDPATDSRIFDGTIDEVAVFNSTFSPAQILSLYAAATTAPAPAVTVSIQLSGPNVVVTWPQGILLEATNPAGPWFTNLATSPYTVPPGVASQFYRVQNP